MIKDKIKNIIEMLILSTKCGNLEWLESGDNDKRDFLRKFFATGEDGSIYETDVRFIMNSKDGTWQLESSPSLWIKSDKLPNGSFYVYGGNYDLKDLRNLLRNKYCQDMNPSEKVVEDALDSIYHGISVVEVRENKLNKVLGFNYK
jgi:hypothetical protein